MDIIEKTYKAQIDEEIIDHVISAEYPGIIKENNIVPVDYFKLTKVEITKENLEVVFEVPVLPEIKLGEYKGLKIKKEKANVTDETVNQEIEKLLASSGKLKN
jgi:trigger factor